MEQNRFKVGDLVEYVLPNFSIYPRVGDKVTITATTFEDEDWFCRVAGSGEFFYQWRFEKVNKFKGNVK